MLSRMQLTCFAFLFAALIAIGGCNMAEQSAVAQPAAQVSTPDITCDQLVSLAESNVGQVCDGIGRNQACYGNHLVSVAFRPNSALQFNQSGDVVDLLQVQRISTSPLNLLTHDWGIAVVKAQANLPDSLPGQNVTFLLYGDTTVDNPSPDMHAVTISTRIGSTNCTDVPDSAVLIQSPEGSQVAMTLNGAEVTLGSTAYVTASVETQRMTFAILEGTGIISADGVTKVVLPGMKTGIPLGGPDGLQADGAPSDPAPYDYSTIQFAPVSLLDRAITIPEPGSAPAAATTEAPQPVATSCTPREDWTYRYVIQSGDFLSTIALRLNMRTADLQAGNCIADPNRLIAGQTIRVPRPVPLPPTATPLPVTPTTAGMTGPNLRADKNPIGYRECTNVYWDTDNIDQVYFEGQPVTGHDSRQVCPSETTTYTLLVILHDGSRKTFQITITVQAVCGNQICEPGESYSTCPSDCLG